MRHITYFILPFILLLPLSITAQKDDDGPVRIDKSEALEMTAPSRDGDKVGTASAIEGDFDAMPIHPACAEMPEDQLLDCTMEVVMAHIRARLKYVPEHRTDDGWLRVTFEVDQYGDAKNVRVEHHGDEKLSKAVLVAMYGLDAFSPAQKDGGRVRSKCNFIYPLGDLFN